MKYAIAIALLLGGCTQLNQRIVEDDNKECRDLGLKFGTGEFAQCRLHLDDTRRHKFYRGLDSFKRNP